MRFKITRPLYIYIYIYIINIDILSDLSSYEYSIENESKKNLVEEPILDK